ncbi:MAG: hypothetical protein IPK19_26155 [Chloroflexi bacterium]|nr:hypothetical protein [Chloroflexota bacterium]
MPVIVAWDNDERTIVRTESSGHWTWEEYHTGVDQALALINSVDHPVHLINVRHPDAVAPEGYALPHLRRLMRNLPKNHRMTIMVNPNMQNKMMMGVFRRVVPIFSLTFMMARTLDEARNMIALYERKSGTAPLNFSAVADRFDMNP